MKSNTNLAVWMLLVSVLLKMIIFGNNWQFTDYERYAIFANVFVLMTGVFIAIRQYKVKNKQSTFPQDFKAGMRQSALYAIFMSAFVYIYYSAIDPTYFDIKLQNQLELAKESGLNLEQTRQTGEFVLSPFFQTTLTLIGFLLLGSFYSGILSFLMRKFPSFRS